MKPEFTRPFDLDHAMFGAPIATVDRGPARFVAYVSHADSSCCVIILDKNGVVGTRRKSGRTNESGAIDNPHDLVMIPLGMIDGKPVFVGDEVVTPTGMKWVATPTCRASGSLGDCAWPAPVKVYPVTQMTDDNLSSAWSDCPAGYKGLRQFANAALRHAIDAGQVVMPCEAVPGLRPFNPYTGRRRFEADIAADPMGHCIRHKDEPLTAYSSPPQPTKEAYDQCSRDLGKAARLLESLGYSSDGDGEWTASDGKNFYGEVNGFYIEGSASSIAKVKDMANRGAARDMAIAEAVRDACYVAAMNCSAGYEGTVVRQVGLAAIIATIK